MNKLAVIALHAGFAVTSSTAFAGVAPNTGGSQMSQSGAKIAPSKPATEEKNQHQEVSKEQAK